MNNDLLKEAIKLLNEISIEDERAIQSALKIGIDCIDFSLVNKIKEFINRPEVKSIITS